MEDKTKRSFERLAHLISTRHFPPGGREAETAALDEFKSVVTSRPEIDPVFLRKIRRAAMRIGHDLRSFIRGAEGSAHFSLAASGSLEKSSGEGGRGAAIRDAIKYLEEVPEIDAVIEAFGLSAVEKAGVPRWKTWFRDREPTEPDVPFGDTLKFDTIMGHFVFHQGFDEVLGKQVAFLAMITAQAEKDAGRVPSVRVLTVAEPGGKARIVTTGPWWLYIVEQPISHVMKSLLFHHPSARAGLTKSDQLWHFLRNLEATKRFLPENFACLSSDLKCATDALPFEVIDEVFTGFFYGLEAESPFEGLQSWLLKCGRNCETRRGERYLSTRGIFMGEPMAKPILTLINLVYEQMARDTMYVYGEANTAIIDHRPFAVAGDDHIAVGSRKYLEEITRNHIRGGSLISLEKHAISRKCVRYCEKLLLVNRIAGDWAVDRINGTTAAYEASPFVDSIKVRLISPSSKGNESFNEKNTAIGKCIGLGATLRWLNTDHFPPKWVNMVRDRAICRMGRLLPPRESGVYWHLLLPTALGGLGLYLESDLPRIVDRVPLPTKILLKELAVGVQDGRKLEDFQKLCGNVGFRGHLMEHTDPVKVAIEGAVEILGITRTKLPELIQQYPSIKGWAPIVQIKYLAQLGWLTKSELERRIMKPFLFNEMLSGTAKRKPYNTEKLKSRYAKLWDLYPPSGSVTLSEEDIRKAFKFKESSCLFSINETIEVPYRETIVTVNALQEATLGLPDFSIDIVLPDPLGFCRKRPISVDILSSERRRFPVRRKRARRT